MDRETPDIKDDTDATIAYLVDIVLLNKRIIASLMAIAYNIHVIIRNEGEKWILCFCFFLPLRIKYKCLQQSN